jgi:ATPase subunit of ABC transporter with duplicated ATPase domains
LEGLIMANIPQRFDHTDDGFETANDGDFVSYNDYAYWRDRSKVREAELDAALARVKELEKVCVEWVEVSQSNYQRAKRAEARVKELEGVLGVLRALSYTHSRGVRSEEFVSLFKGASHALGIKIAKVRKGANAEAVMRAALLRED